MFRQVLAEVNHQTARVGPHLRAATVPAARLEIGYDFAGEDVDAWARI
jgi:hypothetical protein